MSITLENTKLNVRLAKRRLFDGIRRQSRKLRGIENPQKVFCIGRGKTGSTSMYRALWDFGYLMGDELEAATLYDAYYYKDEFGPLIEYCKRYEAFQDLPFSAPNTFKVLDAAFPGSKFILTVRNSSEQWYSSLLRFNSKRHAGGKVPTYEDLQRARYIRTGYSTHIVRLFGTTKQEPFNKELAIASYENHNKDVISYFADRPNDLLVLNVAADGALQRLAAYLNKTTSQTEFPWENKT